MFIALVSCQAVSRFQCSWILWIAAGLNQLWTTNNIGSFCFEEITSSSFLPWQLLRERKTAWKVNLIELTLLCLFLSNLFWLLSGCLAAFFKAKSNWAGQPHWCATLIRIDLKENPGWISWPILARSCYSARRFTTSSCNASESQRFWAELEWHKTGSWHQLKQFLM